MLPLGEAAAAAVQSEQPLCPTPFTPWEKEALKGK